MRSCLMFAVQANGHEIRTVESLGTPENLHPLQEAFTEKHALQCGFCTPGFLMSLVPFLEKHPDPTDEEIREAIDGNLCRCTGYRICWSCQPGGEENGCPPGRIREVIS